MRMRPLGSPSALPLGMALLLLSACQTTKSSGPSSSTPSEPPTVSGPSANTPWQRARVGDAATYTFSAQQGADRRGGKERSLRGQVTLEVVAVQQPWVWLRVSFAGEAGQPLPQTRLAQPQLLPMRADVTRPLEVAPLSEPTAERATAAGRTWEAQRYEKDARPVDGALVTRVYAREPGPLYLTRGLLSARNESAGFRVSGSSELTLREVREGPATASAAAVPALERPLGPGTWYDRRLEQEPTPVLQRVCLGAERGFFLRTEGPVEPQGAPCASFAEAEPEPLEEVLMRLVGEGLTLDWPPAAVAQAQRDTFRAEGHEVPALTAQRTEIIEGIQRVYTETYAAEPWSSALSGLAGEARFQALADRGERVEKGGQRVSEGGSRLVRWGAWWNGAK